MSAIVDFECNTADLKIFFEIHKSALDSVNLTTFKVQNLIILILKVGKLG